MKLYKIDGEGWRLAVAIPRRVGQPWQSEAVISEQRTIAPGRMSKLK